MANPIRVLHLIDSLATGGAERVAINFVNALNANQGTEAWLCAARSEGALKDYLKYLDKYIYLSKKSFIDICAFFKLIRLIQQNDIHIIHAHSSSFLWAVLASFFVRAKVIWHDHNGARTEDKWYINSLLRFCSRRFKAALAVNKTLHQWAIQNLHLPSKNVYLLNNFPDLEIYTPSISNKNEELIIVCLANLRHPKDHFTLLQGMAIISKKHPQLKFKLWLVGRDYDDLYSKELKSFIESEFLQYYVFLLGSRNDVSDLLSQSHIGVLSSESEGLPVALLEYGLAGLPVVCTSVGECPEVLGHGKYGIVVPPKSPEQLAEALALLINEPAERKRLGTALQVQVQQHYSRDAIMKGLLELYHEVMSN